MDSTDTQRGGIRHELAVEPGGASGRDGEGDRVQQWIGDEDETGSLSSPPSVDPLPALRTGVTHRFAGIWGCTHVAPVAGGAEIVQQERRGENPTCGGSPPGGASTDEPDLGIDDRGSEPLDRLQAITYSAASEVMGDV